MSSHKMYGLYGLKHHIVEIKRRCHYAGRTNDDEQLKIELLSQWKLEAEFRNNLFNFPIESESGLNEINIVFLKYLFFSKLNLPFLIAKPRLRF